MDDNREPAGAGGAGWDGPARLCRGCGRLGADAGSAARRAGRRRGGRAGAGEGNRTLVCSLGSCRSTIELRPPKTRLISLRFSWSCPAGRVAGTRQVCDWYPTDPCQSSPCGGSWPASSAARVRNLSKGQKRTAGNGFAGRAMSRRGMVSSAGSAPIMPSAIWAFTKAPAEPISAHTHPDDQHGQDKKCIDL